MSKYGMMMVCGNSIEELEHDLAMLKMAVASGATMGCGGATLADVEKGVAMLGGNLPTAEPCSCGCGCCHTEEDDEYVDENTTAPTIYEILEMVENGEITADEADELMRTYYEVED